MLVWLDCFTEHEKRQEAYFIWERTGKSGEDCWNEMVERHTKFMHIFYVKEAVGASN